jgi:methyltransferase (TIGR00027 family)
MNEPLPSKTCLYVAAGRALGAREADEAVRNPDYLAERLLGPKERVLVADQACVQALDQDYALASKNMEALGVALMMQVRTRFIEERLAGAIERGATQLVILGAGFDTRGYRLTELLRHARVFEVDQPSTQEYKRRRVREAGIEVPANLTYVPVDFRREFLGDPLSAAGYDSSALTFFIWEGVTMYLPEATIEDTFQWVGSQAPGSVIVFDFVYRAVIDFMANIPLEHLPEQARLAVTRVQKLEAGEPWVFGIPNGNEREYLAKFGLRVCELLPIGGEESQRRYLTRSDGSFYFPLPSGMQRPPVGAAANPSYCLAEAVVTKE